MKKLTLTIGMFLMLSPFLYAQHILRGSVFDADSKEAIPGATIQVVQENLKTTTNQNGQFTINSIKPISRIQVSFLGYIEQDISVDGQNDVTINLYVEEQQLDEVVVVGYGTQSKRSITGSISSVDMESKRNLPNVNVGQVCTSSN